jgi:hypothetical protein
VTIRRKTELDMVAIQSMFVKGGEIRRFSDKVSGDIRDAARRRVPKRSRRLWRNISVLKTRTLPLGVNFVVGSYTEYALWVEEGTKENGMGKIYPHFEERPLSLYSSKTKYGERFIPAQYAGYRHALMPSVQGQEGKHYLRRGLRAGFLRNSLIIGK